MAFVSKSSYRVCLAFALVRCFFDDFAKSVTKDPMREVRDCRRATEMFWRVSFLRQRDASRALESCYTRVGVTRKTASNYTLRALIQWWPLYNIVQVCVIRKWRHVPAGNTGISAAAGTTTRTATNGCFHLSQVISQAL